MFVAALPVGARGAAGAAPPAASIVLHRCELADGSTRRVYGDLALRYPALVRSCVALQEDSAPEVGEPVVSPRDPAAPDTVLITPPSRASTAGRERAAAVAPLVEVAARRHGVDAELVHAVIHTESAYNSRARSPKGALGLMQIMPATGARFGVARAEQLLEPAVNIDVGVRYLRELAERFHGRLDLVLAAYNAGEGAVLRNGHRVPPYAETRDYVRKILGMLRKDGGR